MSDSIREILKKIKNGQSVSESELFKRMTGGNTIFKYALERNMPINCELFTKTKSVDLILDYRRYDLLYYVDISTLLKINRSNLSESYLETILKLFKNGVIKNISFFDPINDSKSLYDVSKIYILYAKNNVIEYLPKLSVNDLLKKDNEEQKESKPSLKDFLFPREKGLTLLEIMLREDEFITINRILSNELRKNFDIAMILRKNDIKQKEVAIDLKPTDFLESLVDSINLKYNDIEVSLEEDRLLEILYRLFKDNSDEDAVISLINAYKVQLAKKNPNTIVEIKKLIELKNRGKPAFIRRGPSFFVPKEDGIYIKNALTSTINHEMSHAFFYYLTDGEVPSEFWNIVDRIKNDEETLRRIREFSEEGKKNKKDLCEYASRKYTEFFPEMSKIIWYYETIDELSEGYDYDIDNERIEYEKATRELRKEISEFLSKSKEEKTKIYKSKGYSDEELKILFSKVFTVRDYALMHYEVRYREFLDAYSRAYLGEEDSIGDIIDAIYEGKYFDSKLKYKGETITPISGHGTFYYNYDETSIFDEILAGYRRIMMSDKSKEYLSKLRYCLGDELVDFLENYYNNVIINGYTTNQAMRA